MSLTHADARAAADLLSKAKRIACICHRGPDGDAIGSVVGIALLLEQQFPNIQVTLHCVDPVPETFQFLNTAKRIAPPPTFEAGDAAVIVDCAEAKMTEMHVTHPQLFDGTIPTVMIDHHPGNPRFGTVNLLVPEAASTCEIVVMLADLLLWNMNPDVATALLTGVYTDTGGLLHSNTTPGVYRTVGRLLRAGARQQMIVTAVFRTAKLSTLKLWGRVLEKISVSEEGGAISAVTEGDFRATGADYSELAGAIDYVNAVPGMRFSMVLSERDGKVKGSLRTLRDDVDVAAMAGNLSGGGHKKAAGFAVSGKLKPEVRWKVIEEEAEAAQ
ncbi:bifunctional oligoribonuclease/PAP phosphatase NrnA [Candidatus Peribacteria bacterium]|nr:MAG: bifunctional oligoribonuclease/PAP phosphatase NrnA [Candidatus Peribacteria bacterium]